MFACLYLREEAAPAPAALVALARRSSPRIEVLDSRVVTLDADGLTRLFGGPRAFADHVSREAASCGLSVSVAVAGTRTAAVLMAGSRPGVSVVPRGREAAAVAVLPLSALSLIPVVAQGFSPANVSPAGVLPTFDAWGLKTLGDLAALDPSDLAARFGDHGPRWWRLARGDDLRPLVSTPEEPRFEQTLALDWPIEGLEPLSFALARLIEPLSADLERRGRGAAVIHTWLTLVTRRVHHRAIELPAPMRDARVLRTLVLLDLESHPPDAGIDAVRVAVEPAPSRSVQHSLLTRPLPPPDAVHTLTARLSALCGDGRVGSPMPVDSHRPGAFTMTPFAPERVNRHVPAALGLAAAGQPLGAVLRRFRRDVPIGVALDGERPVRVASRHPGLAGGAVVEAAGPWRTSGEWWGSGWDRDEWDVALADRAIYRVHRDRATGQWFVEGVWD